MKRATVLCLCLLLGGTAAAAGGLRAQRNAAFDAFWLKFKAAVIAKDKEAVSRLSKFPIGMSYGMKSVRNKADLSRRYREVFNEQSDAAQCFAGKQPEVDAENPRRFTVACPNEAGDEVVIYEFELTRAGWKFVALDNINE
jgi:hypothetical protein